MRKIPILFIVTLLMVSTIGCAGMATVGKPSPTIVKIQQRGALIVGTAANMPPLNMMTKSGIPAGLDIDLARIIAAAMGVELRLVKKNFAELLPALEAGQVDMVISGMTITPARNLKVAFAGPYHITGKSFLTRKATIARIENPADLDSQKFHFTALAGSTSEELVQQMMPEADYTPVDNYDAGVALVLSGKADAMVSDYHACIVAAIRHPDAGLVTVLSRFTYEPLGIALPPGDSHLLDWMENFLGVMEQSGELDRLKQKWIEDTSWINDLP